jgi:hypothetical protein
MSLSTLLDAIERTLSSAFEAGPLRVLQARLEPVHIVRDVERLLDRHVLVTDGGPVVPHQVQVRLHPSDVARLSAAGRNLEADLAVRVQRAVRARGMTVLGPVVIQIQPDDSVASGRVRSEIISATSTDAALDPLPATSRLPTIKSNGPNVRISLQNGDAEAFTKSVISIGRDAENDLVVPDPRVSRRHAELHAHDGRLEIRDLQSTNGTWIGDNQIQSEELVCPARVSLGGVEIHIETFKT